MKYSVELDRFIKDGNQTQEYYFWVEIINEAHLKQDDTLLILVNDAP